LVISAIDLTNCFVEEVATFEFRSTFVVGSFKREE
jgi:hypothetical protein